MLIVVFGVLLSFTSLPNFIHPGFRSWLSSVGGAWGKLGGSKTPLRDFKWQISNGASEICNLQFLAERGLAHGLRSGGFVSRLGPKFEVRNPG
jgi:hypothetical protein